MKKVLKFVVLFILLFVVHLTVSLLFNWAVDKTENIGRTIISSLVFTVIYSILDPFVRKMLKK
jgi:NADH:ubiquinone oxidoreductase subunit 3 (subunit A)